MKHCRWCDSTKSLDDFYPHALMADGHLNKCKECVKQYAQQRRLTSDRPREIDNRRYQDGSKRARTHPKPAAVRHAHNAISNAIRDGKLTRPESCERCGASPVFVEAAHHDYSKPMDVEWLCRRCHRRWDSAAPKTVGMAS